MGTQATGLGNRLSNLVSLGTGAAGVRWSGPDYQFIFEWIFYLSIAWALVSICREAWSNKARLIRWVKKVAPWHIIVLGLVIALGGTVWLALRTAPSNQPAIASQDLVDLKKSVADLKQAIGSGPDSSRTNLLFEAKRLEMFQPQFEKACEQIKTFSSNVLSMSKLEKRPQDLSDHLMSLRSQQGHLEREVWALQTGLKNVLGRDVNIVPADPTAETLARPVPGDQDISDTDTKTRYRINWWKTSQIERSMKDLREELRKEAARIYARIGDPIER